MSDTCPKCGAIALDVTFDRTIYNCHSYQWHKGKLIQSGNCETRCIELKEEQITELQRQVRHLQEANEYNIKKLKAMPTLSVPVNLGWFQIDTLNVPVYDHPTTLAVSMWGEHMEELKKEKDNLRLQLSVTKSTLVDTIEMANGRLQRIDELKKLLRAIWSRVVLPEDLIARAKEAINGPPKKE